MLQKCNEHYQKILLIVLNSIAIIAMLGYQQEYINSSAHFGMHMINFVQNHLFIIFAFPICYFVFVKQTMNLSNKFDAGLLFLFQGLGIAITSTYFSNQIELDWTKEAVLLTFEKSYTYPLVRIIPMVNFIAAIFLFISARKKVHNKKIID